MNLFLAHAGQARSFILEAVAVLRSRIDAQGPTAAWVQLFLRVLALAPHVQSIEQAFLQALKPAIQALGQMAILLSGWQ